MRVLKSISLLIFLVLISGGQYSNLKEIEGINFFDSQLDSVSDEPILKIYFEANECGEFGGHEEFITVTKKNRQNYQLNYEKFHVNCDSMVEVFNGIGILIRPIAVLAETKGLEVYKNEKQALLDFTFDMVQSKFKTEEIISHSEIKMSVTNADSSLYIWKYGGDADHYYRLLKRLKVI